MTITAWEWLRGGSPTTQESTSPKPTGESVVTRAGLHPRNSEPTEKLGSLKTPESRVAQRTPVFCRCHCEGEITEKNMYEIFLFFRFFFSIFSIFYRFFQFFSIFFSIFSIFFRFSAKVYEIFSSDWPLVSLKEGSYHNFLEVITTYYSISDPLHPASKTNRCWESTAWYMYLPESASATLNQAAQLT